MPAYARREIVPSDEVGVYHCTARCVRRAFLCGVDSYSGQDYEHRREWIRQRLEHLASIFAIDICVYTVMSNHLHLVVRTRPDLVPEWSAEDVAWRWMRLHPPRDPGTGQRTEPSPGDINRIASNPERIEQVRGQLASLSWFMRCLCEPIARRANKEDECTGRFWEGRFHSQRLIDEGAILAGSIYVDLNPIRAGMAETPEEATYTSAFDRICGLSNDGPSKMDGSPSGLDVLSSPEPSDQPVPTSPGRSDAWLCKLSIDEGPNGASDTYRYRCLRRARWSKFSKPRKPNRRRPHRRRDVPLCGPQTKDFCRFRWNTISHFWIGPAASSEGPARGAFRRRSHRFWSGWD